MGDKKLITTTCTRDCPNTCGLVAEVEDGRLLRLSGSPDHPLTAGVSCMKTSAYVKRLYSQERIIHPMIRRGAQWQKVSWDDALDMIADRMKAISEEDGPEAILYYQGYGERTALKLLNSYFFNLFGGVTTIRGSLCGGTGQASQNLDLGDRISHDPLDHYHSRAMILWARNPVSTNISLIPIIREISKKGGRIISIDPFRTRTAALADRHIAPSPGKDVFLAMAAAQLVLAQQQEDREFLEDHSRGFSEYLEILNRYTTTDLCLRAGVGKEDAEYLAQTVITCKPASILLGWGLHRHRDAHLSIRAIDALAAICGTIGVAGGGVSQGFEEYGPYDQQYWGTQLNPPRRTFLVPVIGEEILNATDPAIRMIFSTAANPVCMAPNTQKVKQAFEKTEFVVYSGHFLDDTADCADVFLPATMFPEEDDVMATYGHNYVGPVNKAVEPQGECLSDYQMFYELAKRFPFKDRFCRPQDEWLADICAPICDSGCPMEQLRQGPFRLPQPMVPYQDRRFPTPSGKFEFMTSFDPAPLETVDDNYPFKLLTVAPHRYICSERTLADHAPQPVVRMNTKEARKLGFADGATVTVASRQGELAATLQTDGSIRHDCLVTERGGWLKAGHGINLLTRDEASTVGDGTPYYETTVRVDPFHDNKKA